MLRQKRLNLLHAGKTATVRILSVTALLPAAAAVLLRLLIARRNDTCRLVVVGKLRDRPLRSRILRKAELVEPVAHAHHVVVVCARRIYRPFALHLRPDGILVERADAGQFAVALAVLLHWLQHLLPLAAYPFRCKHLCLRIVVYRLVVRHHRQPRHVLALLVRHGSRQPLVVGIAHGERFLVELHLLLQLKPFVQLIPIQHPQPLAADGGVAQQRVRISNNFLFSIFNCQLVGVVKVHHAHPRQPHHVLLRLAALEHARHGKQHTLVLQ